MLYWIQINQRARTNEALDFAVEQADALDLPVVVYQGLRPDYPGANDRIHTFILEGAIDLLGDLSDKGIRYLFHLERRPSAAAGLLAALARYAALVVTDHFPAFIIPGQTRALARQLERPIAAIDASCTVPLDLFPSQEFAARTLRPKIHGVLPYHLTPREEIAPRRSSAGMHLPFPFPAAGLEAGEREWLDLATAARSPRIARTKISEWVACCAIDHRIAPSPLYRGGSTQARSRLQTFVETRLPSYPQRQDDPALEGTSRLSPYLHFGQISAHEVALTALAAGLASPRKGKTSRRAGRDSPLVGAARAAGSSAWLRRGADRAARDPAAVRTALERALAERESPLGTFLEQLIVRRELAFNFCERNPHHASIEGLPGWARQTLDEHAADTHSDIYDRERLEWSETKDEVWNAAQSELRLTGVIHNRMRMLWGKKILEWSKSPQDAVRTMIDLHDRYALDGRDPNTYANILWCLGLHDRPFGPARPILGTVRPMSSEIARKKFDFDAYRARLAKYDNA